jgi:transmembrane sensor
MSAAFDTARDRDEHAAHWCLAFAEGPLTPTDQKTFDRWLAQPDNAQAFSEAANVWDAIDVVSDRPELIHMRSAALEAFRHASRQRWARRVSIKWAWVGGIAASLLVAAVATTLLYEPTRVYRTGIGERQVAMLDDGSKLSLDAATEVDVRINRGRRELVLVRGRAKFNVAKDPLRPFSVTAGDKIVVATGTAFTVEMLDRQVRVLLYEGHVAVLDRDSHTPISRAGSHLGSKTTADQMLMPGKELVTSLGATTGSLQAANVQQSLSWEADQLTFDDEPLGSAVARINRYSKETLYVGDPEAARARINGVFTAGDTEAFVEAVTILTPVRAVRGNGKITFRQK